MSDHTSAQPTLNQAFTTPGNPATQNPTEASSSQQQSPLNNTDPKAVHRTPNDQPDAKPTPSALGLGPGAKADRVPHGADDEKPADTLDGEQMRAPGEGEVMAAQFHKTGFGEQESLTKGLEGKKEEQREAREEMKAARRRGGGGLGGVAVDSGT